MDRQLAELAAELHSLAVDPDGQPPLAGTIGLQLEPQAKPRRRSRLRLLPAPEGAKPDMQRCPVGFCVPPTGASVSVAARGELCERHAATISAPLLWQLRGARARQAPELEQVLAAAITEARKRDRHWRPWAVHLRHHRGKNWHPDCRGEYSRIEAFGDGTKALRRAVALDAIGLEVRLIRGATGERITAAAALVETPHQIEDGDGHVIGRGPTLAAAMAATIWPTPIAVETPPGVRQVDHLRAYSRSSMAGCVARSCITGRALSIGDAIDLQARAKR